MSKIRWIQLEQLHQDPPVFRVQCENLDGYYFVNLDEIIYPESKGTMCCHIWETLEKRSDKEVWHTTDYPRRFSDVFTGKTYNQVMSVITNDFTTRC